MVNESSGSPFYPLTSSQLLIWAGQRLQPDDPLYNMVLTFELHGAVNLDAFQLAHQKLVESCDVLNCSLITDSDPPRQRFSSQTPCQLEMLDFSDSSSPDESLSEWVEKQRVYQFPLQRSLTHSALIKLRADLFVWYLNQHHLVTDASSSAVLFERMQGLYGLALNGKLGESSPLPSYRDYIETEAKSKTSKHYLRCQKYWNGKLKTPFSPSTFYRRMETEGSGRTERLSRPLGKDRTRRLGELSGQPGFRTLNHDLSQYQIIATLLFAFLFRITGNRQIAVGTPAHGRISPQLKQTAGLFIELFPLHCPVDADETFESLHKKIARETQQFLINTAPGLSSFAHNRNYDVVLNYITASFGDFHGIPSHTRWIHPGFGDRGHLLRLQVYDFDCSDELTLDFDMSLEAFSGDERARAVAHFIKLCDAFLDDPKLPIAAVPLTSDEERERLIVDYNRDARPQTIKGTIVDLFREQVARSAAATALKCGQETMSYSELDSRSSQWAHYLTGHSIGSGDRVALYLTRSMDAVVVMIGIMKCGAAYIPLDIEHPAQRTSVILEAAVPSLIITSTALRPKLPETPFNCIDIDQVDKELDALPSNAPSCCRHLQGTAYVIYTSGSTGQPKGVVVNHPGLANYISWASRFYLQGEVLDFPLFSSLSFDLTVTSIFTPLVSGSRVVIYPERMEGREVMIQRVIEDNQVDIIKLTPSHLALLKALDVSHSRVKKLIVGGEDLRSDLAEIISRRFGERVDIFNEYGPTEGTVACMIHHFDAQRDNAVSVPIGRAIDNLDIYILDGYGNPAPEGVVGEIFIGGAGVADGYLNAPEQTAAAFTENPFRPGEKMYASGDLGRWSPVAQLEFLGRRDHQVKIRGVRVELAEIERTLAEQQGISECVVVALDREEHSDSATGDEFCCRCGLSAKHPDAHLDEQQVCRICRNYEASADKSYGYFGHMEDLRIIVERAKASRQGEQDCIALLSGGKDSSYALCKLVDMGLNPLVFTLENGYISDGAKANIRRLVDNLGLELHIGQTPFMDEVFVDSLNRHSNVCNGCFKTIYTLSMKLAHERGIDYIFTGLSRGQIFETRLADLFRNRVFDPREIERTIIEARKAYHRLDDVISQHLDVEIFQQDEIFERIQFVDFYRYCDVTLQEVLDYLDKKAGWIRPADTGRSTNCLINEAGIYVHKLEQGYHNYSLPYSWDVRLGHKERDEAREELEDDIDPSNVNSILKEIGYRVDLSDSAPVREQQLVAYYVADDEIPAPELRKLLGDKLPEAFIPAAFVRLDRIPLTVNGKLDRAALPKPERQQENANLNYAPPRNETETQLANLWAQILGVDRVGRNDSFFDLGGDSILNIQIVAGAKKLGLSITPQQIFDHPTVAELAGVAKRVSLIGADQQPIEGCIELTPIQRRFFEAGLPNPDHYNQEVRVEVDPGISPTLLREAIKLVLGHHDGLRSRFDQNSGEWQQTITGLDSIEPVVDTHDLGDVANSDQLQLIEKISTQLNGTLNLGSGDLIRGAYFQRKSAPNLLILVVHHLVIDGVSWWILLQDLDKACQQLRDQVPVTLPPKSASMRRWSEALSDYANSAALRNEIGFWTSSCSPGEPLPRDLDQGANELASAKTIRVTLDAENTRRLLHDVPAAYRIQVVDVMLTGLLTTLGAWSGQQSISIDLEGHGREEIAPGLDLLRTVGWFTSVYPLRLQCQPQSDFDRALTSIKEQLRAVPNRGIGYGVLRYLVHDESRTQPLAKAPPREILFNYMGRWERNIRESGMLQLAAPISVSCGTHGIRLYAIEINAAVFAGRLHMDWTYSDRMHLPATIEYLADATLNNTRALIDHCLSAGSSGHTPSDFPDADIDQSDLDALLAEFGEE